MNRAKVARCWPSDYAKVHSHATRWYSEQIAESARRRIHYWFPPITEPRIDVIDGCAVSEPEAPWFKLVTTIAMVIKVRRFVIRHKGLGRDLNWLPLNPIRRGGCIHRNGSVISKSRDG